MSTREYPTGTVTFLFTDIAGSTRLWETNPDAMRVALAQHNDIMHSAVDENEGMIFKLVGDAVYAAFAVPASAVLAAVEAQRRLLDHTWPSGLSGLDVRMAIHTGAVAETNGDYFGQPLNRIARLMALAYPGQILVSHASAMLATDALPADIRLREIGVYRLKDLSEPERTAQVVAEGLRTEFPPLPSLDSRPNNLPFEIASFVGRAGELAGLDELFGSKRLITVVGTGGIGKTRLALQAAANAIELFPDGTWFVEAASIGDPELLSQAIAVVLDVREEPQRSLDDTLAAAIGTTTMLIVLDGVDRVIASAAPLVKKLLSRCASLNIVVTSREPLHLTGERIVRVGPLDEAVQLFRERATELTTENGAGDLAANTAAIAQICEKLDSIPLAIELAAASVTTISVDELLARLSKSMKSLVSRDPTREQRHRTLRAAIAWSFDLLSRPEASALRALATFAGTFDIAAAAAVLGQDEDETQLLIDELVLKSMMWVVGGSHPVRYVLMTTIREYLRDLVDVNGEAAELARRHGIYFADYLGEEPDVRTDVIAWRAHVDDEIVNIRQSLEWALEVDSVRAASMMIVLSQYWKARGFLSEGGAFFSRARALPINDQRLRARLLRRAASFAIEQDDYSEARALNIECRQLYEKLADTNGIAETFFNVALIEQRVGHIDRAFEEYYAAIAAFRAAGNSHGETVVSHNLAVLFLSRNQLDEVQEQIDRAESALAHERTSALSGYFMALRGSLAFRHGSFAEAEGHLREAIAVQTSLGNRQDVAIVAGELSGALAQLGKYEEAAQWGAHCLTIAMEVNSTPALICGFEAFCEIAIKRQHFVDAARLFVFSQLLRESQQYNSAIMSDRAAIEMVLRQHLAEQFDEVVRAVHSGGLATARAAAFEIIRTTATDAPIQV